MTKVDCESIRLSAMAREDGYVSDLSADQIESHLVDCSDCRREVQQLRALGDLLDGHTRRQRTEDIWKQVEQHLPNGRFSRNGSRVSRAFVILSVLLLGYRLVQLIPDHHFGIFLKIVPILFVIAAFTYLRENPFKINSELTLEGK